jgi:hypothetical protein
VGVNEWVVIGGEDGKFIYIDEPFDFSVCMEFLEL